MLTAWWRYLDRSHKHEILVTWDQRAGRLAMRERSPPAPETILELGVDVGATWEVRVVIWELEARLATLGKYWRQLSADGAWRPLAAPPGAEIADARENEVLRVPAAPLLHHFHDERNGQDDIVAALGRKDRYLVMRAHLDMGALLVTDVDVLHDALPDALMRSLVLQEEQKLARGGLTRLVTRSDYDRAFGLRGPDRARRLVEEALARARGEPADVARAVDEDAERIYAEFLGLLDDPRLLALHWRFLDPGEEERLMVDGPIAIRKAIATKRALAPYNAKHLLTIVEASLLARERMKSGKLAHDDPEVLSLAHLSYYL